MRRLSLLAALFLALSSRSVFAQASWWTTSFDCTHSINMAPSPIPATDDVHAEYFCHVWEQDPIGQGVAYEVAPPWTQMGNPYNEMPPTYTGQPATFNPYGVERLTTSPTTYGPWSRPYNACRPNYSATNPPCVSLASPVTTARHFVPVSGTGPGWMSQIFLFSFGSAMALSEFHIQPRITGSGYLSGTIRSAGRYHEGFDPFLPDRTYAFAWSELEVIRQVRPAIGGGIIALSWGLPALSASSTPPQPQYLPYVPPGAYRTITRFYDPISFSLRDLASNSVRTGELFQLAVDLSMGGSCTGGNGSLWLDTPRGGLRVRIDHPWVSPHGTIDLEIDNGLVVTSRATGCFASMALPPVGAVGPHSINFPTTNFDLVFDATGTFPGDHDVTFFMGGAGAEEIPEAEATGAACDNGVCASGVTQSECLASGATWQGPGTACPDVPYFVEQPLGGFEDISSFGIASIAGSCDNCGESVPLGFTFDYFGTPTASIGLSSNGYLALSGSLSVSANPVLPSAAGPNGVIAGYWDDLNPLAGGGVHYATLGSAPDRRFVAQWTEVPHSGAQYRPHTFQIVLHETTNEIEYRYLDVPVVGGAVSPTVGIENPSGASGLALDPTSFVPNGNRRFVPAPGTTCPPPSAVPYCTAGVTTNGCHASMSASGAPSASASSGFVVSAASVEGQKQGLIFYGVNGSAAMPWGPGSSSFLCVKSPVQRTPAANSFGTAGQCDGTIAVDLLAWLAAHPGALGTPFVSGQACWVQAWFRDPPSAKTTNLSNALAVTFQP